MTYEKIKTIILIFLVVLSIVLTWNIWTYQPKYDTLEKSDIVPGVLISEQKEVREIVRPDRVFHHFEDIHYGTINMGEIDRIIKEINKWGLKDFEEVTTSMPALEEFLYESGQTQMIFPAQVPLDIYKNTLGLQEKEELNINFDRIIIDMNHISKDSGYVYFVSQENSKVYRAMVAAPFLISFKEDFYSKASYNKYFKQYALETLTEQKSLLVGTEKVTMPAYNYLLDVFPSNDFRDALFRNPSFVKRNYTGSGEEFKDSSTLLSVNYDTNTILYVNTAQERGARSNSTNLLQRSIDFVNNHGGWTDNYIYVGMDSFEKTVLFRIFNSAGYPVFNNNGMAEILQIWGQTGIYQYMRNNFTLDRIVETTDVEMISGIEALNILMEGENFDPEFLQDLVLGYEMTRSFGEPLIHLEPTWYYEYKDQWWKVYTDIEDKGGADSGLE